jgi:DNA invertase Pin-like site-specific DNA recombinase
MNCVLYARVSTDKQASKELSIPAQLEAMRQHARSAGWVVAEEFLETGASAKTTERPVLQQLLTKIRSGDTKIDVVLVHKIDRFARNVYDHATIKALLLKHGARLSSVVENVDDTVSGQLVENIMASIAQFYSGNLSEEVKKGMRQKVLKGGWPHLPPRGYVQVRSGDDRTARVEVHPREGSLVRAAFERYASGWHSLKTLAAAMAREGLTAQNGQPLAPAQVQRMLTNPFYVGQIRWQELTARGSHEPLVSRQLFDMVAKTLARRHRDPGAKGSVNGFSLRGIAICSACRGHMTAGWHKKKWGYYRCSRRSYSKVLCAAQGYCPAKAAHEQVAILCGGLRLSKGMADGILKEARAIIARRSNDIENRLRLLTMTRSRLLEREMRLTEAFATGDVAPTAYKPTAAKLRDRVVNIEGELQILSRKPDVLISGVADILSRATSVWELHEEFGEVRQVELLRVVFRTIVLSENGVIGFTLNPPFGTILKDSAPGAGRNTQAMAKRAVRVAQDVVDHVLGNDQSNTRRGSVAA